MAHRTVFRLLLHRCLLFVLIVMALSMNALPRSSVIILHAEEHLGARYKLGTSGPDQFDCSGLIRHCFADIGINLPHSAEMLGTNPRVLSVPSTALLCVGDLVFFDTVRDDDPCDHVGIWMGNNRFIHASSGDHKVKISEFEGYYVEKYSGAKRYLFPSL